MEREACVCDHGFERSDLCAEIIIIIIIIMLLFLTFSELSANPKKLLYTVANPARGLLNREKRKKEKVS